MRRVLVAVACALLYAAAARLAAQAPACYAESFDTATPPALPSGWTAYNAFGSPPVWQSSGVFDGTVGMFLYDPEDAADKRLESPPIPITSAVASLTFVQNFAFWSNATTSDGGVLEVSSDGDAFQDVTAAGGGIQVFPYNGALGGAANPLAGRAGWTSQSNGTNPVVVELGPQLAGHTVRFRWRVGSGGGGPTGMNWEFDNVAVVQPCVLPAALHVDDTPLPTGPFAPANSVLEPGETVVIDPVYLNGEAGAALLSGTASGVSGPGDSDTYTITDGTADYDLIAAGGAGDCLASTGNCYALHVAAPATRPAFHWDADLQEDLSDGSVRHWRLHVGDTFADVPESHPFYRYAETVLHKGVTAGCAQPDSYCPDGTTLRKQMAVFVLKASLGPTYTPRACTGVFADVPCPGPFADWIEDLYSRGVVAGCGASPTYCPDAPVSRQQMSVFLLKTLEGSGYTPPACTGIFQDVPCANPFAPWIEDLAGRQITGGCGGGNYCPLNPTTRGQMAVFLTKTFGLTLYGP